MCDLNSKHNNKLNMDNIHGYPFPKTNINLYKITFKLDIKNYLIHFKMTFSLFIIIFYS